MKVRRPPQSACSVLIFILIFSLTGCGGRSADTPPPIQLSVTINNTTIQLPSNGVPVGVQVIIMAPTETATFSLIGLPAGVSWNYKESESNPSGLLTLTAATTTVAATYKPTITVGSSGQTASLVFTMVVSPPAKTSNSSLPSSN
jgi:hypothetical protein